MQQLFVINFKAYPNTIGEKGLKIAKTLDEFAKETGKKIIISVSATDIRMIKKAVDIPVYAQGFDPVEPGSKTGHITLEALLDCGMDGTLINHSEKRIPLEEIKKVIDKTKSAGKTVIVCVKDPQEAKIISEFEPDYVAIEPPELIGGDISVSKAKPEIIEEGVKLSKVPVLVGAGIKTYEDVKKAAELGSVGVLVASGIVKKDDVKQAIKDLTELE